MASQAVLTRAFYVGCFQCTLTFPRLVRGDVRFPTAEWLPRMPEPGELSENDMQQYRKGRDQTQQG